MFPFRAADPDELTGDEPTDLEPTECDVAGCGCPAAEHGLCGLHQSIEEADAEEYELYFRDMRQMPADLPTHDEVRAMARAAGYPEAPF